MDVVLKLMKQVHRATHTHHTASVATSHAHEQILQTLTVIPGTSLFYKPGIIVCGKITHHCENTRSIGYFLEGLVRSYCQHTTQVHTYERSTDSQTRYDRLRMLISCLGPAGTLWQGSIVRHVDWNHKSQRRVGYFGTANGQRLSWIFAGILSSLLQADAFRTVVIPSLSKFGISDGVEFKILKRGAPPRGG